MRSNVRDLDAKMLERFGEIDLGPDGLGEPTYSFGKEPWNEISWSFDEQEEERNGKRERDAP